MGRKTLAREQATYGKKKFWSGLVKENTAQSEWSAVYLLLVFMIAAILLIAVIKPMFQQSQKVVSRTSSALKGGS